MNPSQHKPDKTFMGYHRRVKRDLLFEDLMSSVNRHRDLCTRDKLFVVDIIKRKIVEGDKK